MIDHKSNISVPYSFNIIFIFIWLGLLFASQATDFVSYGITIIFIPLINLYNVTNGKFPGYEILSVIFLVFLISNYKLDFRNQNKYVKFFIVFTIIFTILSLVNPNNGGEEGIISFLGFKMTASIIFASAFSYIFLTIKSNSFENLYFYLFKYGMLIALIKASFDLISFILGIGPVNYFNATVTTIGGDIQIWYAIFHIISFSLFLYFKKKKYLIFALIFIFCLIFSYQRTALGIAVIFDLLFSFIITLYFRRNYIAAIRNFILFILIITSVSLASKYSPTINNLMLRYGSAFQFTGLFYVPGNLKSLEYSDSGHFEQSINTSLFFLNHKDVFWGGGLNRRTENYLFIEGQSQGGTHNNIVAMWQYFGIPGVVYYLSLFVLFLYFLFKTIKNWRNLTLYRYLVMTISLYFIIRAIAGWFSGDFIFLNFQNTFQLVFLVSILKLYNLNPNDKILDQLQ